MVKRTWIAGLFFFAAAGCGGTYSATLSGLTAMPDGSFLGSASGHLHTGIATAFTPLVTMQNTFGTHSETDGIVVNTSNPSVLQAAAVTGNSQGNATSGAATGPRWIVWAVAPGTATLTVTQDGNVAANIPVEVTDP